MRGNKRSDASATGGGGRNLLGFRQPSILLPRRDVFLAEGKETADLVRQVCGDGCTVATSCTYESALRVLFARRRGSVENRQPNLYGEERVS